jgi:hypothetical protein
MYPLLLHAFRLRVTSFRYSSSLNYYYEHSSFPVGRKLTKGEVFELLSGSDTFKGYFIVIKCGGFREVPFYYISYIL